MKPARFRPSPMLLGAFLAVAAAPAVASAEPATCSSPNPPAPSRPYFMLLLDASDSMSNAVTTANSCKIARGYSSDYPDNRIGHARCAILNTVSAFGGEVNFGFATFGPRIVLDDPDPNHPTSNTCPQTMQGQTVMGVPPPAGEGMQGCIEYNMFGNPNQQCGSGTGVTRSSANILVPLQQDNYWDLPALQSTTNVPAIASWIDNQCGDCKETLLSLSTPINGALRDMYRYLSSSWTNAYTGQVLTTPLKDAATERSCRSINVILMTDGGETCDVATATDPNGTSCANAAKVLLDGFDIGAGANKIHWSVKTHVIEFGNSSNPNAINTATALAGGTTVLAAIDETALSATLANIITSAIQPEKCDNTDNNCNGCTDEGSKHYCDHDQTCCAWNTDAQRTQCLATFQNSISAALPQGDVTKLPCTTVAQQTDPLKWLCYNPSDVCDDKDNNCSDGIDENLLKCGNPLHCPQVESCNGLDDNCNAQIDESVCNGCVPSPEICDGCDNDCNGIVDDGAALGAVVPCGLPSPANCAGTMTCKAPVAVPPGTCSGSGFDVSTCSDSPHPELCNGIDDDCNGSVDDSVAPVDCFPANAPANANYGPNSHCVKGSLPCNGVCTGAVGPTTELCNGIDDDCNGIVDDNPFGLGQACGAVIPPCVVGTTVCVNGALSCNQAIAPQPEVCDGIDNDCDGTIDDPPLVDAPLPAQNGCWNLAANPCVSGIQCSHGNLTWCAPVGATCYGNGALSAPCNKGTLVCAGLQKWTCSAAKAPTPEVCDGLDNDCNGQPDDGALGPPVGDVCGSDVGECSTGHLTCLNGVIDCPDDVGPTDEICDGLDNNCNSAVDDNIPPGGPCTADYDTTLFPGARDNPPCQPGTLECQGLQGMVCVGGVPPDAELCDGFDNDCDGMIDEAGAAPDGVDGSEYPFPPPEGTVGGACGGTVGTCTPGTWVCSNATLVCLGGQEPVEEECDCNDNDCDGTIDNENPPDGTPLCGEGKQCVHSAAGCQCAEACKQGEFKCALGLKCEDVSLSQDGSHLGLFCIDDFDALCGDCATKEAMNGEGTVVCAPESPPDSCAKLPVCTCKGPNGCQTPCFGVACPDGQICADYGPHAGKCGLDNCYNNVCQGCGEMCSDGVCIQNPCHEGSCAPDEVCKPIMGGSAFVCVGSCVGVDCPAGQACVDGECAPDCNPACGEGFACDNSQSPPVCVANACTDQSCLDGSYCDPATGDCGNYPCEGVLCPDGQVCSDGSCVSPGGEGGSGGGTTTTTTTTTTATTGAGAGVESNGIFGLATGGGGCSCRVSGEPDNRQTPWAMGALLALSAAIEIRRRGSRRVRSMEVGR